MGDLEKLKSMQPKLEYALKRAIETGQSSEVISTIEDCLALLAEEIEDRS